MMRLVLFVAAVLLALSPAAAETLNIAGSTDRAVFEPVLEAFRRRFPDIDVRYMEYDTIPLDKGLMAGTLVPPPDIAISSAADRQYRLANDGLARKYRSHATQSLPEWARFGDEAFGLTFEPLVFVVSRRAARPGAMPTSRAALIEYIDRYGGTAGTYDPTTSGVGYLAAHFDIATNSQFAAFIRRFSKVGLKLFCCSTEILDEVAAGRLDIAFNVLGSYALQRRHAGAEIEIIYPEDYTLALMRVAIIPKTSRNPAAAGRFLDFLISDEGQTILARDCFLPAIRDVPPNIASQYSIRAEARGPIRVIGLDATLLALSDDMRRRSFGVFWQSLVDPR